MTYAVSGLHAQIQTTQENLVITDLDSTNGTFIDQRRLQPRVAVSALPGNLITFGMDSFSFHIPNSFFYYKWC